MADKIKPKESEVFYGVLFDNMPDGLAYCQMVFAGQGQPVDFIYVKVNKNFEKLTGLKDVQGKKVSELIPGITTSNPELFEIYGRVALGGKPERFETYVKPLARWFLVSVYSPKKEFFIAIFQNITSRKQVEKDLDDSRIAAQNVLVDLQAEKEKLAEDKVKEEAILLSIGDGLVAVDESGNVTVINESAQNMLGFTLKEIIGKPFIEVIQMEDEKGNQILKEKRPITMALSTTTTTTTTGFIYYYVRKDKTKFPVAITVTPVKLDGKSIGAIGVFRDITRENELNNTLKRFQLAVDFSVDGVLITDLNLNILYVNQAWQKITGYWEKEAIGRKPNILQSGKTSKEVYEKMWQALSLGKSFVTDEIINKRKDGFEYEAQLSIYPLQNNGKTEFYVGLEQDITERKNIDKAKTEFVSLASHQLRTPLSTINWYLEMLMSEDKTRLSDDQIEYAQEASMASKRMVGLVNALLNVSRIELGTFSIEPRLINIAEIIKSCIKEYEHKILEKKLEVSQVYDPAIPKVMADPKLLDIVCQNLLENAINYTPREGKIKVSLDAKGSDILITVEDSGIGIPKNQQTGIFTKLFRADNARETEVNGNGLGLYMTKAIIEHAGGKIWFSSKAGASGGESGTTFYVSLPISGMRSKKGTKELD